MSTARDTVASLGPGSAWLQSRLVISLSSEEEEPLLVTDSLFGRTSLFFLLLQYGSRNTGKKQYSYSFPCIRELLPNERAMRMCQPLWTYW